MTSSEHSVGSGQFIADAGQQSIRRWLRLGILAGIVVIVGAYMRVLYHVADVTGVIFELAGVALGAVALATLLARTGRSRAPLLALALVVVLLVGGAVAYLTGLSPEERSLLTTAQVLHDTWLLLTGMSVLQIVAAGSWVLAVTPAPTFLAWFLVLRDRYVSAVIVSGALLGLFVLTGDATLVTTLAGVVGAVSVLALGSLVGTLDSTRGEAVDSLRDQIRTQVELLTVILAVTILVSATVGGSIGAGGSSGGGDGGDGGTNSVGPSQASLVNTSDQLVASGPISLSPRVRFVVYSEQSTYWRTAAYDRYTGDGWVRTGQMRRYEGTLSSPPGATQRVEQTVAPQTTLGAMPAANQPVSVDDQQANQTLVTTQGTIEPDEPLTTGDNYTVVSRQPTADPETLRETDDYGESVDRYRQLPASTPDRVHERAAEVAGDEATAYDKAIAIERHLETTKNYSTVVQRPDGDIADGFLFEMDAGYCTYFATTMAVMLRSQNVPARVAVGYTPGQRLESENGTDAHVVRGYNAHAWVEVYFEDVGWVAFDPTPSGPRLALEYDRLRRGREQAISNIDAAGSVSEPVPQRQTNISLNAGGLANASATDASQSTNEDQTPLPEPRTIGLLIVGFVGAAAITRRRGGLTRARTVADRYYQSRRDPNTDVQRAWNRIEATLARSHRPRRPGESVRAYVQALADESQLDPRVSETLAWYQQARYGEGVDWETADTAVEYADALTRRRLPLVGRRYQ
jgi:transglutaminase-like putative cysteine protease